MAIQTLTIRFAIISTFLMFLFTGLVVAQTQATNNSEVTITNTGSSDMEDYIVTLSRSGDATYEWRSGSDNMLAFSYVTTGRELLHSKIPMLLVNKFFADLDAGSPVASLPDDHNTQTDALTTVTYVTYRGQTSPDLSRSDNTKKNALYDDIVEITSAFASKEDADDAVPPSRESTTRTITLADHDKTISLKVGQTLVLELGANCHWAISGMDQEILDQKERTSDSKDSERIFRAVAPGIMMLRAVGGPDCGKDQSSGQDAIQDFQAAIFIR